MKYKSQRLTELIAEIVLRPFVPHDTKKIAEGERQFNRQAFPTLGMRGTALTAVALFSEGR